jgi:hypothetical protein
MLSEPFWFRITVSILSSDAPDAPKVVLNPHRAKCIFQPLRSTLGLTSTDLLVKTERPSFPAMRRKCAISLPRLPIPHPTGFVAQNYRCGIAVTTSIRKQLKSHRTYDSECRSYEVIKPSKKDVSALLALIVVSIQRDAGCRMPRSICDCAFTRT